MTDKPEGIPVICPKCGTIFPVDRSLIEQRHQQSEESGGSFTYGVFVRCHGCDAELGFSPHQLRKSDLWPSTPTP